MAYSELIKNFERIRDYMRQFYVYGFKSRSEYGEKSARSYDNERRRIESWLGDYMAFRREESGKQVFLSMDSRVLAENPLHNAFRAKSFTDKDITLHFYILDLLEDGEPLSVTEMAEAMDERYLCAFPDADPVDISTLRKKLKEYEKLGLLRTQKRGRELLYSRAEDTVPLENWETALRFYAESEPLGVIGSFLLDRLEKAESPFRFKHHYLIHTLDSEILCQLLTAIREKRQVELTIRTLKNQNERYHDVFPVKLFISTQTGRQYVLCRCKKMGSFRFFRLDTIHAVHPGEPEAAAARYEAEAEDFSGKLWGVSTGNGVDTQHIEMDIRVQPWEGFLVQRLEREKRGGTVEMVGDGVCRFSADVFDAMEMLPWIRTFTGRILRLECSNSAVTDRFHQDLEVMNSMYGGDTDAVS